MSSVDDGDHTSEGAGEGSSSLHLGSVEVLTLGDELVEGRLIDSNSGYFSSRLVEVGLAPRRHVSVGDRIDDIVDALRTAASRSRAVLVSGGLGPTTDDLTAEAAAEAFGRECILYPEALEHTRAVFARLGRVMPPNNEKQAWLPAGSTLIDNPRGSATGFLLDDGGCRLYFFPGVPHELKAMFERSVLPDLKRRLQPAPVRVGVLQTFGLGESRVGSLLETLRPEPPGRLVIQYRAAFPEVHVRLCLTGYETWEEAGDRELERLSAEAEALLGTAVFALRNISLPEAIVQLLRQRQESLATAESCTGGLVSSVLTAIPGASEVFLGGAATYANEAKVEILGIPAGVIEAHGAVSQEVAGQMADRIRQRLGSTWGLAITGIAGPGGGSPEKPVGTVFIALSGSRGLEVRELHFPGDRDRIRTYAAWSALDILRTSVGATTSNQEPPHRGGRL